MTLRNRHSYQAFILFFIILSVSAVCPGCKSESERLKEEVVDVTQENERLKTELNALKSENANMHMRLAQLNLQISALHNEIQNLQKDLDAIKMRGRENLLKDRKT